MLQIYYNVIEIKLDLLQISALIASWISSSSFDSVGTIELVIILQNGKLQI